MALVSSAAYMPKGAHLVRVRVGLGLGVRVRAHLPLAGEVRLVAHLVKV